MSKFNQKSVAQRLREIQDLIEENGVEEAGKLASERNLLPTESERKEAERLQLEKSQVNQNNEKKQFLASPPSQRSNSYFQLTGHLKKKANEDISAVQNKKSGITSLNKNSSYLQLTGNLQKQANDYVQSDRYAELLAEREKEKIANELKQKRYELEKEYKETKKWLSNVGGQGKYLEPERYSENEQKAKSLKKEIDLLSKDIDNNSDITIDNKIKYGANLVAKSFVDGGERLADFLAGNIGTAVTGVQKILGADEQVVNKTKNAFETLINVDVAGAGFDKVLERNAKIAGIDQNAMPSKLAYSIGTNVFDLGTSLATGGKSIYSSVGGGHLQESLEDGATLEQATIKSDIIGAVIGKLEGTFNKVFGVTGDTALSKVASKSKTVSKFINDLSKTGAGKAALKFINETLETSSEIGEEFAEEILDDVTTKIIYDKTREIGVTADEAKEIAIMTALSTFALRGITGQALSDTEINEAIEISKNYIEENKVSTEKLPVAREESKNIANQNSQIEENTSNNSQNMQAQKEAQQNSNIAPYNNEKYVAEDVKAKMQQVVDSANKINKSDVKLEFTQLDGNKKAQTDGNTIKIDISKANLGDVIHEITHNTENSKGYLALSDYILTELDKRGELQGIKEEMNTVYSSIYEQEGRIFTEKDLENEIVANYTEKFANDENFVNKITKTDRNFAQKIYDWIKEKVNYYKTVSNMTDEQRVQYDELKRAEKLWMKALKENNNESLFNNKYKIFENDKGKYVKADRQVITGKNPQIWKKQTENYINEQIRKGKDVIFYSEDGTPLTISKNTAGKATFRNDVKTKENTYRKMTDEEFKSKLQAEVHIDELAQISRHKTGPVPDTKNHIFARDGFSYRTAYFEDGNGQYYRVTMSIGQNGEINTIYNIGKMDKKSRSNSSLTAQRPSRNKSTEATPSIINSITSQKNDVNTTNTKYSIQESENNSGSFNLTKKDNKGRTLSQEQQEYFKNSKVRDENGNLKTLYHGTQRADRVGNYFNPEKATSGPMAFFTDSEQIATNYSNDKTDTSLSREYDTEKDLFKIDGKTLEEYWTTLSNKEKQKINENGKYVGFDEDWENIVFDKNNDSFNGQYDYYLKNETQNNGIEALYKTFIEDGNLYGEDISKFKQVLELAGLDNIEYLDSYKIDKKVYEVYLNIKTPFDTSDISSDIVKQLETASKRATIGEQYSADMWDKSNITPEAWMERLNDDIKNDTTHAWIVIPDWVTNVLKRNGYDGIIDTGGKNGGQEHQVIIPFYSEQIKNVDNSTPTNNPDIRYSVDKYIPATTLNVNETYETGRKEAYNHYKYSKEQGYNNAIVEEAKNLVKPNNQGRRTKEQWLKIAEYIGVNTKGMSVAEIEETAYKSWFNNTPNSKDNLNRQGQKYVKFTVDEWINKIYENANNQKTIIANGKEITFTEYYKENKLLFDSKEDAQKIFDMFYEKQNQKNKKRNTKYRRRFN